MVPVLIAKKYQYQGKMCPEMNEEQSVTSPSGESLGKKFHMSHSKRIKKYPQKYDPGLGAATECNNDNV